MPKAPAPMKLFVWNNPYDLRWGNACAYAIAPDADAARKAIRAGLVSRSGETPEGSPPADMDIDRDPDRVLDGPYGEIYEWEM